MSSSPPPPPATSRPHTGRRRNPAVRDAVLRSAAELLAGPDGMAVSIDAIARMAGVSKHTIYRWWPSKGAVLLEAVVEHAQQEVAIPDTGALVTDLATFLADTFRAVERAGALLRRLIAEALRDTASAQEMREFIVARRGGLRSLLVRGQERGELPAEQELELTMDQIYGLMWYRLLIADSPLTADDAARLARSVAGRPHS
ncbi:TetR family transcriptional regulator [Sphaerisporangium melleum]|uniref:TetR family transcriptional regulator n=1 Tax=Sphaerisporangium melleum TaxID=321316 RepID=A0A917RRX8_9ACTN|nr:TetR/AcrR family transcriptional regulator [Sphaerisporangium melleum]GGL22044.1 TetR family transcriptional regulator [Sphaerisporangium melleum]GII75013.1 TetR family transcriptional regulator [Sphaerisporangium melleum]